MLLLQRYFEATVRQLHAKAKAAGRTLVGICITAQKETIGGFSTMSSRAKPTKTKRQEANKPRPVMRQAKQQRFPKENEQS